VFRRNLSLNCFLWDIGTGILEVVVIWTLILDPGFCIIALHCLDSTSAACDGLVVISIVVIYGTEYTLPHSSHSNNEQCTGYVGYCMRITELNAV
jgi:hypothetical protein